MRQYKIDTIDDFVFPFAVYEKRYTFWLKRPIWEPVYRSAHYSLCEGYVKTASALPLHYATK